MLGPFPEVHEEARVSFISHPSIIVQLLSSISESLSRKDISKQRPTNLV